VKQGAVKQDVEIMRDAWGIPHIFAANDLDLFFGFGLAMGQDRLWQLDYLRRKALGRLAEILGAEAVDQDVISRTVGIRRIASAELKQLPPNTLELLEAFVKGINAAMPAAEEELPIEFALLDYAPEAWSALDTLAIWGEFRWYLTGRLPVIALPEVARRHLGSETLYAAFLTPESGEESIVPAGMYAPQRSGGAPVGATIGDPDEGSGSNNWAVAGSRSANDSPMLATDPHIAFGAVSCWYEVHLCGGSFNTTGMAYVGVPAVVMGRNEDVAWCLTNNICSQRDLYLEQSDEQHPGAFLYDGQWEAERTLTETIKVRDGEAIEKTIRFSRNGPLVNHLLPKAARDFGPVSLRWLGATFCDELSTQLDANRARSNAEFRRALAGWRVPTWNFIFADRAGHINYQAVGQIPVREGWERGFRHGWDPNHQWRETIPYEAMPAISDPPSGWVRTANNRNASEDFPYPLSGTWSSGHRAERIRHMLEAQPSFSREDFRRMHYDVRSQRAAAGVPPLLRVLDRATDARVQQAAGYLRDWNFRMEKEQVAASLFELFFRHWSQRVAAARFTADVAPLMVNVIGGLALELLSEDKADWFADGGREQAIIAAFEDALAELEERLGADMDGWQWGNLHTITLRHPLSRRGDLSTLLDRGGYALGGNGFTVCNTAYDPASGNYEAATGANYRLIADLGASPQGLWAVDAAGESGNPGSEYYCSQLKEWLAGDYHFIPLERADLDARERLLVVAQA
jgi:penicillin amidase